MNIIWWLVPAALALGLGFLVAFIWSAKSGQYEDLDTPAVRILFEPGIQKEDGEKDAASREI